MKRQGPIDWLGGGSGRVGEGGELRVEYKKEEQRDLEQ